MKRSALRRLTPLKQRTPLKSRPKRVSRTDAEFAWKDHGAGYCECGCGSYALRRERHHVLERSWLIQNGFGKHIWDQRNGMLLAPHCHERHTNAFRRIPLEAVPESAREFAIELLGFDRAALEIARRYGERVNWRQAA